MRLPIVRAETPSVPESDRMIAPMAGKRRRVPTESSGCHPRTLLAAGCADGLPPITQDAIEQSDPPMSARAWFLLIVLATCFSGTFFFNRVALDDLSPLTIVLGRVGLGAAILNLVLIARGQRLPLQWPRLRSFLVMGALSNAIPFVLVVAGQIRIASGLASILNAMTPLCTILVAHVLTRSEPLKGHRLAGVLIGFSGAVIVIGPTSVLAVGRDPGTLAAQFAILGATLCYAFAVVYGRRFRGMPPTQIAAGQLTGATVLLLPLVLVVDRPWTGAAPGAETIGAIVGLGLVCWAIAYVLFNQILAMAGPTNLTLVTFLVPIGALLLGTTLLGERIEPRQFLGMAVIFIALTAVDGRLPDATMRLIRRRGEVSDGLGMIQTKPARTAQAAAAPRLSTPSLARMLATCLEAVRGLMKSALPISRSE
jgi:drug/metabolite transporter (DMT)-like permease